MGHKIIVAGIGPGGDDFISPAARHAIDHAKILVGGRRALSQFAADDRLTFPITADIDAAVDFIRSNVERDDVTVMVSGDPGYYSLLDTLRREFDPSIIEVIPSISAMQLAFARAKMPWHDATLLSFHGRRPPDAELFYAPHRVLGLLTDGSFHSQSISKILLALGWAPDTKIFIALRLSYPDEQLIEMTLGEAAGRDPIKHCVLIVGGGDDD
ncbi:MAG: precorrin-6y C5,15-methyltransferase (decarboxylating) subunit CbiE [Selenomonadaceae bacterium]|nr:precorrin-6y C5,15-methyltransferase (decarboxylating) subunit CbiE [Selenomonadaceae bacterium]